MKRAKFALSPLCMQGHRRVFSPPLSVFQPVSLEHHTELGPIGACPSKTSKNTGNNALDVKSCGPDAPTLASSSREAIPRMMVARKPGRQGATVFYVDQ